MDLEDKTVFITGGSRGLGFALAQEFAARGSHVAVCARSAGELDEARSLLRERGAEVTTVQCDVGARRDVEQAIEQVAGTLGPIDVLVNNAGIMEVGPIETQSVEDFERSMRVMFWGMLYPTMAVLPSMCERGSGRIVNITSLGGKVSAPHMLPYSAAKFAAVGFSEGLRGEVARSGVRVVTVVPGFMRTGSTLNASFKGDYRREYSLFSVIGNLPGTSISARRAARRIVRAAALGEPEVILGGQANLAVRFEGLFPATTTRILAALGRVLPQGGESVPHLGKESQTAITRSFLTTLERKAAESFHQYAGNGHGAGHHN